MSRVLQTENVIILVSHGDPNWPCGGRTCWKTPLCLTKCTICRRVHVYSFQRGWSSGIGQCHRGSGMWVSLQSSSLSSSSSSSPSSPSSSLSLPLLLSGQCLGSMIDDKDIIRVVVQASGHNECIFYHNEIVTITCLSSSSSRKQSTERNCHKKSK